MENLQSIFQCPSCGSTEYQDAGSYIKCASCGNTYERKLQDKPVYADLAYAFNQRQEAKFDEAQKSYERIIEKYIAGSGIEEAHWGRFLCEQHVIFYQNEHGESIPSFWNISNRPCYKSESYQKVIGYNNGNTENYKRLANLIEEYKKKYRRVAEEFHEGSDVFICFKDSGTDDANLGYKIYNQFSGQYNVFFSRDSLNHITGNDYEPYIYHALNTAKVMIVICSSREALDSKWVHNEWWRFWNFSQVEEKTIIPVFREGFDSSELPDVLKPCQGHPEDVDLISTLTNRLDAALKNKGGGKTLFEKELNKVNDTFEMGQVDEAKEMLSDLLDKSADQPYNRISALLMQAKIFSNNYRHLDNESAKDSIAGAEEIAKVAQITIGDISEYRRYRAAVAKKRLKIGFIAFLITAIVGVGAFFAWYLMQDTSVKNLSNSKYHAAVEAETGRFELGTEFQVAEIQADNLTKSEIRQLPINQSTYHLYEMELWRYGSEVEVEGNVTVTMPLPSGISADRAVVYYMSGDTPEQIPATVSKGNISFTTNHFSVYMIAEEKDGCNHITVIDRAVAPTCTEEGLTEGQHCSLCKETLVEQETVPAKGHTPGQAANCTEGQHCTVCHIELATAVGHKPGAAANCVDAQKCTVCHIELAPARGHRPSSTSCTDAKTCTVCHIELEPAKGHTPGKAATCTEAQYCTACHAALTPAKGHKPGAEATCTEGQKCTECGVEVKAALGHKPGEEATCTTAQNCQICGAEIVSALGHKKAENISCTENSDCTVCGAHIEASVHTPGAAATCLTGQYCTVCNEELAPAGGHQRAPGSCTKVSNCIDCGERLPALSAHTPGAEATCTEAQICTVCNTEIVPALGHKPGAPATCASAQTCTVCQEELAPAKEHTPSAEATCTNGQYCAVCRLEINPPKGHSPGAVATCTAGQNCTVCGIEITPAQGHVSGTPSTCVSAQTCVVCGTELAPLADHRVNQWTYETNSENTTQGQKYGTCSVCGQIVRIEISYSQGLSFSPNGDDAYTVTGIGSCKDTAIIIPMIYQGKPVTAIAEKAFKNCTSLISVEIPSNIQTIGVYCFQDCTKLKIVKLNEGLKTIYGGAFTNTGIKDLIIPHSVTTIAVYQYNWAGIQYSGAFEDCKQLVSVVLGSDLSFIQRATFRNCTSLKTVTIGDNVKSIGEEAFHGCTSLDQVRIGSSVTKIEANAFKNCTSLSSIEIPSNVQTIGIYCFNGCTKLETVKLNEGLKTIYGGAFMNCGVKELVIPDSVTTIETYSYYRNGTYYDGAFEGCKKLTSVILGNNLTVIYRESFQNCTTLATLIIGEKVETIGAYAFAGCTALSDVTIGPAVKTIQECAFQNCTSLISIVIPSKVETIGENAFLNCNKLSTLTLNEGLKIIYGGAFMNCAIKELTIPNSVTNIQTRSYDAGGGAIRYQGAFAGCTNLSNIIIGNGLLSIERETFIGCTALKTVTIGDNVKSIGVEAFHGCTSLSSIEIPGNVQTIGENAFLDCSKLSILALNEGLKIIYGGAFTNTGIKELIIPDSVSSIATYEYNWGGAQYTGTFENCNQLVSVVLGSGLSFIQRETFRNCTSLKTVTIGNKVESIGVNAFYGCTSLDQVIIGSSVKKIEANAFENCTSLSSIEIPASVQSIGLFCFQSCSKLETVTFNEGLQTISSGAFQGCPIKELVLPNSVTEINSYHYYDHYGAFEDCKKLTTVTLGKGITSIERELFKNCTSLSTITFTGTVEQWSSLTLGTDWRANVPATKVVCSDGEVALN